MQKFQTAENVEPAQSLISISQGFVENDKTDHTTVITWWEFLRESAYICLKICAFTLSHRKIPNNNDHKSKFSTVKN